MKLLKVLTVFAAAVGVIVLVVRRQQQEAADAALWAEATDTVRSV